MTPLVEATNSRFLFISITITPRNDTIKPMMFITESLSFRNTDAAIGVTSGIIAMMAEPMMGEVFFKP